MYYDSSYANNSYVLPPDDIDPKIKRTDPKWALAALKYIYSNFISGGAMWSWEDRAKINRNRMYADGCQPIQTYKDLLCPPLQKIGDDGQAMTRGGKPVFEDPLIWNITWDILSPAPKLTKIVINKLDGIDHRIACNAIDEKSGDERMDMKAGIMVHKDLGNVFANMAQAAGIPYQQDPTLPKNDEEMEIWEGNGGFKLNKEVAEEKILEYTFRKYRLDKIKRKVENDLFWNGKGGIIDTTNLLNGETEIKYADPYNTIIIYDREYDSYNTPGWGYFELWKIQDLRLKFPDLTQDDLFKIAKASFGLYGNPLKVNNAMKYDGTKKNIWWYSFDSIYVPVMLGEWFSVDTNYVVSEKSESGGVKVFYTGKEKTATETRKTSKDVKKTVYTGRWVCGTDLVFDNGMQYNQKRQEAENQLSLHFVIREGKSPGDSVIPLLDQIEIGFLNFQRGMSLAPPPGRVVNMNALVSMSMGNAKNVHPMKVDQMYMATGIIYVMEKPMDGRPGNNFNMPPVTELKGGYTTVMENWVECFNTTMQQIQQICGISGEASGGNTNPNQPVASTEAQLQATNDILKDIYNSYLELKVDLAKGVICRTQSIIKYAPGMLEYYNNIIGHISSDMIKISMSDINPNRDIVPVPEVSQQEMAQLNAAVQEAIKGGMLDFSDMFAIMRAATISLKYAEQIMDAREKSKKQADSQKAMAEDKNRNDLGTQQAAAKAKMADEAADKQFGREKEMKQLESKLKILELYAKSEFDKESAVHGAALDHLGKHKDNEDAVLHKLLDKVLEGVPTGGDAKPAAA